MCFVICSGLPLQLRNKGKGDSLQPPICTSSLRDYYMNINVSVPVCAYAEHLGNAKCYRNNKESL